MKPITWILKQKTFMWPQQKIFLWKLIQTLNGYRIKTISMILIEFHYMLRLLYQQYGKIFPTGWSAKIGSLPASILRAALTNVSRQTNKT